MCGPHGRPRTPPIVCRRVTAITAVLFLPVLFPRPAPAGPVHFALAAEGAPDPAGTVSCFHVVSVEHDGGDAHWSGDHLVQWAVTPHLQVAGVVATWEDAADHARWRGMGLDLLWAPRLPGERTGRSADLAVSSGPDETGLSLLGILERDPGPWILVLDAGVTVTWADPGRSVRSDELLLSGGASREVAPGWRVGGEWYAALAREEGGPWRGVLHLGPDVTLERGRWWLTVSWATGWHAGEGAPDWTAVFQAGIDF